VGRNRTLELSGETEIANIQTLYQFSISYKDQDGNRYVQVISIKNETYDVTKPSLAQ
jgi:hypothetical protein